MDKLKQNFIIILLKNILINFLIILAFAGFFSNSLYLKNVMYGLYGAVLITLFYKFIRPVLMLIGIIPIIFTFGLFIVVINAVIILLVSNILTPEFHINSFWSAFGLGIFISIFRFIINKNDRTIIIKRLK